MRESLRLGRVLGIDVGVHWSWLAIVVLMLWTLGQGILPAENPGLSSGTYATMAAIATTVFFVSLLLHELGHALVARRAGMQIDGITLWLFGGVARFRGTFPDARTEVRVALAGPGVSVALGALFSAAAALPGLARSVDGTLSWLGYINIALAVFNMLPAQPLDGGRVLHGLLWARRGDLVAATRRAGAIAESLAYVMIAGGLLVFVTTRGAFGGAWLAFLGWFLLSAARLESRSVLMRHALGDITVAELMTPEPVCVDSSMTLGEVMDEVAPRTRFTTYPVLASDRRVVGLLRYRDLVAVPRDRWDATQVSERMVPVAEVPVLAPRERVADALDRLGESQVGRGLVLEGPTLIGILSIRDVLQIADGAPPRDRLSQRRATAPR